VAADCGRAWASPLRNSAENFVFKGRVSRLFAVISLHLPKLGRADRLGYASMNLELRGAGVVQSATRFST
jgi:hypothetical protein